MMNELVDWLIANKIKFKKIDDEIVEIVGVGKMYLNDLSDAESVFRKVKEGGIEFNLMEDKEALIEENVRLVAFKFGDNFYYFEIDGDFKFKILKYIGERVDTELDIPFVNLGVHSPYELLNGSGNLEWWTKKAKYMGHNAIGICDQNTMAGTIILQKACEKLGIKHVFGYSLKFIHRNEEVGCKIYVQSQDGLQNLLRIQKVIGVDSEDKTIDLSTLLRYGCGNILVFDKYASKWMDENWDLVKECMSTFDNCFYQLDLTEYKADRIDSILLESTKLFFDKFRYYEGNKMYFDIEPVLICDQYYLDKDDAKNKIILNKIASGAAHMQSNDQYFKDIDEHWDMFKSIFEDNAMDIFRISCDNTMLISEGAIAKFETDRNFMPQYDMTSEEVARYGTRLNMFRQILEDGFKKLVPKEMEETYRKQLEYEKYIIESTNNVDYLLVQYDTVNWARNNDILVGAGRGSAGGSLILYLMGITMIDPVKYGLIFERFLLPERAGLESERVTKFSDNTIDSKDIVSIVLENGKELKLDIDSKLLVIRGEEKIEIYADELEPEDDIIFDNRDIVWNI